jgi:DNA-directed RNA polymerase beta subunit
MITYDEKERLMTIQKVKPVDIDMDILADQKNSYDTYKRQTIEDDIEYLCGVIKERIQVKSLYANVTVKPLYRQTAFQQVLNRGDMYYPVEVKFVINDQECHPITLFRLPYMGDYCILNVSGKEKILLNEITNAQDIFYDNKNEELIINLPSRKLRIAVKDNSGVYFMWRRSPAVADTVLSGFLLEDGIDLDLTDYFSNSYIRRTMTYQEFKTDYTIHGEVKKISIIEALRKPGYKLKNMRDVLDKKLTIDPCLARVTSREIYLDKSDRIMREGTLITPDILAELKRNLINEVYVKDIPKLDGLVLREEVIIRRIKKGTLITDYLRVYIPEYARYSYLPVDVDLNLTVAEGTELNSDIVHLMYDADIKTIRCSKDTKTGEIRTMRFEQEIVGNYSARIGDFMNLEDIPFGISAQDYTYYYGIKDPYHIKEITNPEYLTCHDLLALVSLMGRIVYGDFSAVSNMDTDFSKKINMINESFSESFRITANKFVAKYRNNIDTGLRKLMISDNPFIGFTDDWRKYLQDTKRLLAKVEDINPVSLLTQANRIKAIVSEHGVAAEMRGLSMGYFGRICPYDTPQSKNVGLVNTIAIGCKIVDGIPKTPYLPIIKKPGGSVVADTITDEDYLSATEEYEERIGDLLSLQFDENGYIKNTKVIAKIKNNLNYGEKMTIAMVDASSLTRVSAFPEQYLSPAAMLMPFAAANDSVRVGFGLGLIKQAIYIQHSEVPYVLTSMYRDMFEYSNYYLQRAKANGYVVNIEENNLIVQYDGEPEQTVINIPETRISNDAVVSMGYKVSIGDSFEKNEILVDSAVSRDGYFSPGLNVLVCYIPFDGYNYEDADVLSENCASKMVSISSSTEERRVNENDETVRLGRDNIYRYIQKGGVIAPIIRKKVYDGRRVVEDDMIAQHSSGILYNIYKEFDSSRKQICKAQLLEFSSLGLGDKVSGRHGNKGVTSLVAKNSEMPMFLNGKIADAVFNHTGVVSRMNPGQLLEAHLGFIGYLLDIRIQSNPFNGATASEIKGLLKFMYDVANHSNVEEGIALNPGYTSKLYDRVRERFDFIRDWEGCFLQDGTAVMINQMTGKPFEYPITFGVAYLLKNVHEVDDSLHSRGGLPLDERYLAITNQPTHGAADGGGQSNGEMELSAIGAHGAMEILREAINEKSDNVNVRINQLLELRGMEPYFDESESATRSSEIFRYYMQVLGVETEVDELPSLTHKDVIKKRAFDIRTLLKRLSRGMDVQRENKAEELFNSLFEDEVKS